jgi:hypothetical protein
MRISFVTELTKIFAIDLDMSKIKLWRWLMEPLDMLLQGPLIAKVLLALWALDDFLCFNVV